MGQPQPPFDIKAASEKIRKMSFQQWKWVLAVAIVALAAGVVWVTFGGLDGDDSGSADVGPDTQSSNVDPDTQSSDVDQPAAISADPAPEIPLFDPFTTPTLSDIDLQRLAAAVATLDPDAACPEPVPINSIEDVAEVVRIAGGCLIVEYVPLGGGSVEEVRERLAFDPQVHAVGVPIWEVWPTQADTYSNDPQSEEQWHLPKLKAKELWQGWPEGAEVTVAVIDSGVDGDHGDLQHSVIKNIGSDPACHSKDTDGHGTHVAGIIAAAVDNGYGVAGVAPQAKILPIKMLYGTCNDIKSMTTAVARAIQEGADVINLSVVWRVGKEGRGGSDDPFEAAIRSALMRDIVVVASAGNCGNPGFLDSPCQGVVNVVHPPAMYPGIISVAATNSYDDRAHFSTVADHVGIAAPGGSALGDFDGEIRPLDFSDYDDNHELVGGRPMTEDDILSTVPHHCPSGSNSCTDTGTKQGTSMAAPVISAVVAHMKARYPKASVTEIHQALYTTAWNPDSDRRTPQLGWGIVQPLNALNRLDELFHSCPEDSGSGGLLAYQVEVDISNNVGERRDVWTIDASTGEDRCRRAHNAWQPAWSPDGAHLAFVHKQSPESDDDIWVMDSDAINWRNLTDNESAEFQPAWSPDGAKIAFVSHQTGNPDIWVVNADGTNRRNLTNHPALDATPAWSPDGAKIAFVSKRDGGDHDIWVMNADGTNPRNLHNNNDEETQPTWSPDGTKIAFVHDQDEPGLFDDDIWVMDADGNNWRNLTDDPASDAEPAWSPDGTKIAFTSDRDGDEDIWIINADGSSPFNLTNTDDQNESHPSWSVASESNQTELPEGGDPTGAQPPGDQVQPTELLAEKIAFVSYGVIYVANPDSSESQRLTPDNTNQGDEFVGDFNLAWYDSDPNWSPDGTRILFSSTRTGEDAVFVIDANGQNVQQLTTSGGNSPSWSPDGTRIVFARVGTYFTSKWRYNFDDSENVFIMDADGTAIQRLTYSGGSTPSWSPDGRLIAFHRVVDGSSQVFVMAPDGSDVRQLTASGGWDASWSPDGRQLVFNSGGDTYSYDSEILVINRDGSDIRQLTSFGGSNAHWSPDGQRIIFESQHLYDEPITDIYAQVESSGILSMRIDGSEVIRIADGAYSPVWSPSTWRGSPANQQTLHLKQITVGDHHSCGLETDGRVVCWGNNDFGQASPPNLLFAVLEAGNFHSCGVDTGGAVRCWGDNYDGESSPPSGTFTAVTAGFGHSCALQPGGAVTCWGGNYEGESSPPAGSFTHIAAGSYYTCGVLSDGKITCWGVDNLGQSSPPEGRFTSVSSGDSHSCALRTDNAVVCWGNNDEGQTSPAQGSFKAIAVESYRSCALRSDGAVVCWGRDYGDGTSPPPEDVFETIVSGHGHSCGLDSTGDVTCWGYNGSGAAEPPPELFNSES